MLHVGTGSGQVPLAERSPSAPAQLYKIPPRPADLTHKQEQIYLAMRDLAITLGRPATARELGTILGLSYDAVSGILRKLVRKGRVESQVLSSQPRLPSGYSALPEPTAKLKASRR
jgi:DNA-binding CsgD family transcriptional regulator